MLFKGLGVENDPQGITTLLPFDPHLMKCDGLDDDSRFVSLGVEVFPHTFSSKLQIILVDGYDNVRENQKCKNPCPRMGGPSPLG